jgi:tRNA 2-thiouridine synthesizing protein A
VTIVDARGLACPLPLAMAKRRMAELRAGESLVLLATDPEAPIDIAAWAGDKGHALSEQRLEGWVEFSLVKGGGGRVAPRPRPN